jgi:hypothetical protein
MEVPYYYLVSEARATDDRSSDRNHGPGADWPADRAKPSKLTPLAEPNARPRRPRGRPKRADSPVVPWDEVDRLLIFGEPAKDPRTGQETVKFPSLADLAKRYGVSRNLIWRYADRAKCFARRDEARLKTQARFEQKVIEQAANARALASSDVASIVDAYIGEFRKSLDEGKVRTDSPSDLDRLVRLKELVTGGPDSRSELRGELTLEAIQLRHRRLRGQLEAMTPELAGTHEYEAGGDQAAGGGERGDGAAK